MAQRALIIEARFYEEIADMLLAGARAHFEANGFDVEVVTVPGVLEVPVALAMAVSQSAASNKPIAAYCMLGCVIRGETGHYDIVANEGNRAVMDLAVANRLPLGNGILTLENREQALVRADPDKGDKGGGAAAAAIALRNVRAALQR